FGEIHGRVADAEVFHLAIKLRRVVKTLARGAGILRVAARDGFEDKGAIFRRSAHGANLVHGPGEGHRAVAAHQAVCRAQTGNSAESRGSEDGAGSFRTQREGHQTGGYSAS